MKSDLRKRVRKLRLSGDASKSEVNARLAEEDARAKAEEFWSDPCWTEPLDQCAR